MTCKGFPCFSSLELVYCIVISRVVGILARIVRHAFYNRSSTAPTFGAKCPESPRCFISSSPGTMYTTHSLTDAIQTPRRTMYREQDSLNETQSIAELKCSPQPNNKRLHHQIQHIIKSKLLHAPKPDRRNCNVVDREPNANTSQPNCPLIDSRTVESGT
jgi:hypothetical protein